MNALVQNFAYSPDDSAEVRSEKNAIFLVAASCSVAGIVWFAMYAAIIGWNITTFLPLGFTVVVGSSMAIAHLRRDHRIAVYAQIVCIIGITYAIQWTFGGLFDSGLVMLWAFLGPLVALMFRSVRESMSWFAVFLVLLVITVLLDDRLSEQAIAVTTRTKNGLFLMNLGVASSVVFSFTGYYVRAATTQRANVTRLLNSTVEGIYGIDSNGVCTFANPAGVQLLGYDSDNELIGQDMHVLLHQGESVSAAEAGEPSPIVTALKKGEGTHSDQLLMWKKGGQSFQAEVWSYPIHEDSAPVGAVVTFLDISERRKIEEELRQTEKMSALGKLSAGLAHELNNPAAAAARSSSQIPEAVERLRSATADLSTSGMNTEQWKAFVDWQSLVEDRRANKPSLSALDLSDREQELADWLDSKSFAESWNAAPVFAGSGLSTADLDTLTEHLSGESLGRAVTLEYRLLNLLELAAVISSSSKRVSTLVGAVKSYTYMDRAPVQEVDIHQGIEDTLTILGHKLGDGIKVVKEFHQALPPMELPGSELNQVWTNLIENAADAMNGSGTLTLRTRVVDGAVEVEVEDDGPGIADEIRSKIFDPFFTTKGVGAGTGLGLDVVRRIVTERIGGEVEVASKPGHTTFTVRIPNGAKKKPEEPAPLPS